MKHKLILMVLSWSMLASVAQAEEEKKFYKYTDENGVTHYSETKPNEDYEEAELPKLSIVPSTPINNSSSSTTADEPEVDPSEVETFAIIAPTNEQNIWGSGGKLTAKVPALTAAQQEKYQIQFIIDGEKKPAADDSTQVFEGIYRGEHTVKALLVNRFNNKVMKESKEIVFFMHQNSKK